jgi:hypothetical protein
MRLDPQEKNPIIVDRIADISTLSEITKMPALFF